MTIVITGGAGYIGTLLSKELLAKKHTVIVVDVTAPKFTHENLFYINCDVVRNALPYNVLDRTDAVINLVGYPINKKWNDEVKEEIKHSRIQSTRSIVASIKKAESGPTVFLCASAIGFYGDSTEITDEQSVHGEGYLAEVVALWEAEAREAVEGGVRVVCVRTAPVLGKNQFYNSLTKTAPFGFLMKIAKKDFWMSWIHEKDLVNTYIFALETSTLQGVVNAAAPEPVLQSTLFATLGKKLKRKIIGTVPTFIMKILYGELYEEMTKNQRVVPKRLLDKGFEFTFPAIEQALEDIAKK